MSQIEHKVSKLPDELPGVTVPSFMKQGLSFWNPAAVEPGRGNSSFVTSMSPGTPQKHSRILETGSPGELLPQTGRQSHVCVFVGDYF